MMHIVYDTHVIHGRHTLSMMHTVYGFTCDSQKTYVLDDVHYIFIYIHMNTHVNAHVTNRRYIFYMKRIIYEFSFGSQYRHTSYIMRIIYEFTCSQNIHYI